MTLENWLMVAVIISTLIAPTIAEFVKPRISHPNPAPEANQPKNLIHRIGGRLLRVAASPWILPPLGIVYDIGVLAWNLRSSAPVTRGVVLTMGSAMVGIAWNALNMNVLVLTTNQTLQTRTIAIQADIMAKENANIGMIIERISNIERRADALETILKPSEKALSRANRPTRALGKLLGAIKGLLGE
jgi:hypothetical protein